MEHRAKKIEEQAAALGRLRKLAAADGHPNPNRLHLEQVRILREVIRPDYLSEEPDAQVTRWAEYGYVTAYDATAAFTRKYVDLYPELRKRYFSHKPHKCPINPEFALNNRGVMNALYRARQFADMMGVPYGPFIQGLSGDLVVEGGYKRVPLPNHLYPDPTGKDKALRHGVRVAGRILHPDSVKLFREDVDPRFYATSYTGDLAQTRMLGLMRHVVHGHTLPAGMLRSLLRQGFIGVEQASVAFPEHVYLSPIHDAKAAVTTVVPPAAKQLPAFRPHCFGLYPGNNPHCSTCDWAEKCTDMAHWVRRQQVAETGHAEPRAAREREQWRNRQREKRARDRREAEKTATEPMLSGNSEPQGGDMVSET